MKSITWAKFCCSWRFWLWGDSRKAPLQSLSVFCAALVFASSLSACGPAGQVRLRPLFRDDDETTLTRALEKVESGYLLAPDRRFLIAISEIYALSTGRKTSEPRVQFKDGGWDVYFFEKPIGRVSRFAGFNEWFKILVEWARTLELKERSGSDTQAGSKITEIETAINSFNPANCISALIALNQEPLNQKSVGLYARGLSALYEQDFDLLDTADTLGGKALAATVVSAAHGGAGTLESATRLASTFGYEKDASSLKEILPVGTGSQNPADGIADFISTPIALYVHRSYDKLKDAARENVEARFLYLKRLGQTHDQKEFSAFYHRYVSNDKFMSLPASALAVAAFGTDNGAGPPEMCAVLLNELSQRPFMKQPGAKDNQTDVEPGDTTGNTTTGPWRGTINHLLGMISAPYHGFYTAEQTREFYRAFAYSDFYLAVANSGRSPNVAEENFKHEFAINVHMPMSRLEHWALGIWHARNGKYNVTPLATQLAGPGEYGARARALTMKEIARWFIEGDPRVLSAGRIFFSHVDSRPENRRLAAAIAQGPLVHPQLAQTLLNACDPQVLSTNSSATARSSSAAELGEAVGQLWNKPDYDSAAKAIADYPWALQPEEWAQFIAPHFFRSFSEAPKFAIAATQSLARREFNSTQNIGKVFDYSAAKGNPTLAFDCASSILETSFSGKELLYLDMASTTYGYLQAGKGREAALDWLKNRVPPQFLNPFAMFALTHDNLDLLWDFIPAEPQGIGSEDVWTCRAAAGCRHSRSNQDKLLKEHFSTRSPNLIHRAGRILLGTDPESSILDERTSTKELCDLAFFLGWNAECRGKRDDAEKWYHLSLETGVNKGLEATRARTRLRGHQFSSNSR